MNFLEKLSESANLCPEKIAIIDENGEREITYKKLESMVNQVTYKLLKYNFNKGSFVLLRLNRCTEFIAAYYGIIKSGYVVVPTLLEYPRERIEYIMKNCNAKIILDDSFFDDLDEEYKGPALYDNSAVVAMNYTSGSTGNPKGVVYSFDCVDSSIKRCSMLYEGLDEINNASSAPMAFAAFCQESMTPLYLNGTVHILSEEVRKDIRLMSVYFEKHHITSACINPMMLKFFDHSSDLKRVFATGQTVSNIYSEKHETYCVYGLTETFAAVTYFVIDKKYDNTPIGKVFGDIEILLLDDNQNEVDRNEEGEIYIVGNIARAYFDLEEQTKDNFKVLKDGRVCFRTHDLAIKDENDNMILKGRVDWMIKINGQRVDISEIEAVLNQIDGIQNGICKAFFDEQGKTCICAYYKKNNDSLTKENIKESLKKKLAPFMIPAFYVELDSFPLTSSGKYDRNALEKPKIENLQNDYEEPDGETEIRLCNIAKEILNLDRIGRNDDIYELGLDSIGAIELISKMDNIDLSLNDLSIFRTPRKIAEELNSRIVPIIENEHKYRKKVYPLLPFQNHYYRYANKFKGVVLANTPMIFKIDKQKIEVSKLADILFDIFCFHPSFQTCLIEKEGKVYQYADKDVLVKPEIIYLDDEDFLKIKNTIVKPFDLSKPPFYRATIYVLKDSYCVFIDKHHIISDGKSDDIFLKELRNRIEDKKIENDHYYSYLEHYFNNTKDNDFNNKEDLSDYQRHPQFDFDSDESCEARFNYFTIDSNLFYPSIKDGSITILDLLLYAVLKTQSEYNRNSKQMIAYMFNGRDKALYSDSMCLLSTIVPIYADVKKYKDSKSLFTKILNDKQEYNDANVFAKEIENSRPIWDDITTINYFPYKKIEKDNKENYIQAESLIKKHQSSTNVLYIVAYEQEDHSLHAHFKYNMNVYSEESMNIFKDLLIKNIKEFCK